MLFGSKTKLPAPDKALTGRDTPMPISGTHYVNNHTIKPPFPKGMEQALFGMGCFWGAEPCFWNTKGVYATAVGYSAGYTPNPNYEEVCSSMTGHNEVVLVIYDPNTISYASLLKIFWESHDPTQGMRQGNDTGTQYRSGIYCYTSEQLEAAEESKADYQSALKKSGYNAAITTEITEAPIFYYAEEYHQQYLAKNPGGYCGLGGTGVLLHL